MHVFRGTIHETPRSQPLIAVAGCFLFENEFEPGPRILGF